MLKIFLPTLAIGLLIGACSAPFTPLPVATFIPSPTQELSEAVPTLIAKLNLETETGTSYTLDWSHDGEILAAGSGYEITLLNSDLSETIAVLKPKTGALGVSWSPDGKQVATIFGYRNPTIGIWNWDNNNQQLTSIRQIQAGSDQYGVSWSPNGKLLATLGDDDKTTIQIWDTGSWEEIHKYELPYRYPRRALNWSADSTTLYDAGESNGQVVVLALNVSDGTVHELAKFSIGEVSAFAISPDAKYFALADEHGIVQIVDIASSDVLAEIKTVDQPVDLAWNPNGLTLAILDYKTTLQLWKVSD
jgi:WD40 repeat protein